MSTKIQWTDETWNACPDHTFQILTKRPERMPQILSGEFSSEMYVGYCDYGGCKTNEEMWNIAPSGIRCHIPPDPTLPLPNIWLGYSASTQQDLDAGIGYLLQTPAAVRFLSLEPLLGPVDLHAVPWRHGGMAAKGWTGVLPVPDEPDDYVYWEQKGALQWVIVGGESGPGARPMDEDWVRLIRDQCVAAGVPLFYKQKMEGRKVISMPELDGRVWDQFPEPAA